MKYLIYAIGEVMLVVIGILIALQVNNWNEKRKEKLREHSILVQLEEDYSANLRQLEDKMKLRDKIIHSGFKLLQYKDSSGVVVQDSIVYHLSNIIYDPTFDPIQNDLVNSGNIRIISNERLRKLLSNWTSDVIAVQEQELINQTHAHEIMMPHFNKLGITRYVLNELWKNVGDPYFLLDKKSTNIQLDLGQTHLKDRITEIIHDVELEGIVSGAISYNKVCNLQSQSLKNRILEILDLVKVEIKKSKKN